MGRDCGDYVYYLHPEGAALYYYYLRKVHAVVPNLDQNLQKMRRCLHGASEFWQLKIMLEVVCVKCNGTICPSSSAGRVYGQFKLKKWKTCPKLNLLACRVFYGEARQGFFKSLFLHLNLKEHIFQNLWTDADANLSDPSQSQLSVPAPGRQSCCQHASPPSASHLPPGNRYCGRGCREGG